MKKTNPIKSKEELKRFKEYYRKTKPNPRNELLIIIGLNTALRISDILSLQWSDVYDFKNNEIKEHIYKIEQKTGKETCIYMNQNLKKAISAYRKYYLMKKGNLSEIDYVFIGQKSKERPISRIQAYRIIKEAAEKCNLKQTISCHSLRKTFGYHAWKQGTAPALLMTIYNHSSYQITKRYLSIDQEDKDQVFRTVLL